MVRCSHDTDGDGARHRNRRADGPRGRSTKSILAHSRMLEVVCGFGFGVVFAGYGLVALLG